MEVMMKRKTIVFSGTAVLLMFVVGGTALFGDTQGWINNSLSFKINERWRIEFVHEIRCQELTFSDSYLKNIKGGIYYNLSKHFHAGVSYRRQEEQKTRFLLHENRVTLETGWNTRLSKVTAFDLRLLTEIRTYKVDLAVDNLTFRLRARVKTKLTIGQLKVRPFIALEPFANTIIDKVYRYRFYAGFVIPMGKNAGFVINYIQQGTKNKETLYILNSGVELKF
jgi:hypothetical protein